MAPKPYIPKTLQQFSAATSGLDTQTMSNPNRTYQNLLFKELEQGWKTGVGF